MPAYTVLRKHSWHLGAISSAKPADQTCLKQCEICLKHVLKTSLQKEKVGRLKKLLKEFTVLALMQSGVSLQFAGSTQLQLRLQLEAFTLHARTSQYNSLNNIFTLFNFIYFFGIRLKPH